MRYTLEAGPRLGRTRVAALCETAFKDRVHRNCVWVFAARHPVALFVLEDGAVQAFDIRGRALDLAPLEALFPSLAEALADLA